LAAGSETGPAHPIIIEGCPGYVNQIIALGCTNDLRKKSVILTVGKDLVGSTRIEILPSFVGQDDILRQQIVRVPIALGVLRRLANIDRFC
jgi:hypothetical protein